MRERESGQQSLSDRSSTTTAFGRRSLERASKTHRKNHPSFLFNPPSGADFPNYNIREYIRRRARERFREAASEATTTTTRAAAAGEGAAASSPSSSPADAAFSAGLRELEAARRQAALARLYHRPQRSVMDVMSTEEHLEREAGRGA